MQIVRQKPHRRWQPLFHISSGRVVEFRQAFHQSIRDGDLFITVNACDAYTPDQAPWQATEKFGVVNVRSGRLSFVSGEREVELIGARLVCDG